MFSYCHLKLQIYPKKWKVTIQTILNSLKIKNHDWNLLTSWFIVRTLPLYKGGFEFLKSTPDTLLYKTHHKVFVVLGTRLSMCRSIMLLGKIAHHMWEVALLGADGGEGVEQNLKKQG